MKRGKITLPNMWKANHGADKIARRNIKRGNLNLGKDNDVSNMAGYQQIFFQSIYLVKVSRYHQKFSLLFPMRTHIISF